MLHVPEFDHSTRLNGGLRLINQTRPDRVKERREEGREIEERYIMGGKGREDELLSEASNVHSPENLNRLSILLHEHRGC